MLRVRDVNMIAVPTQGLECSISSIGSFTESPPLVYKSSLCCFAKQNHPPLHASPALDVYSSLLSPSNLSSAGNSPSYLIYAIKSAPYSASYWWKRLRLRGTLGN